MKEKDLKDLKYTKNNGALINHDEQEFLLAIQRRKKQKQTNDKLLQQEHKILELEKRVGLLEQLLLKND